MHKITGTSKKIALFYTFTFILSLVLIELSLQLLYLGTNGEMLLKRVSPPIFEETPSGIYRVKPKLSYTHRTNEFEIEIKTNNFGFRSANPEEVVTFEKPNNVYRIMTMGPSFTFGWGANYDEIYTTLVGLSLQEMIKPNWKVEVINMGVPSHSVDAQLCLFKEIMNKFEPDLIIQTIYAHNIAGTCNPELKVKVENNVLVPVGGEYITRLFRKLKNFSATTFYFFYFFFYFQDSTALPDMGTELYPNSVNLSNVLTDKKIYIENIKFINQSTEGKPTVVFLYIPLAYQAHPTDIPRWQYKSDDNLINHALAENLKAQTIYKELTNLGIIYINPLDELIKAARNERIYYWLDIHLTPKGNRVVADVVTKSLGKNLDSFHFN